MANLELRHSLGISESDEKIVFPDEGKSIANCILLGSKDEGRGSKLSSFSEGFHFTKKYIYLTTYFERPDEVLESPKKTSLILYFLRGNTVEAVPIITDFNLQKEAHSDNTDYLDKGINVRYYTATIGHTYGVLQYRFPSYLIEGKGQLACVQTPLSGGTNSLKSDLVWLTGDTIVHQHVYHTGDSVKGVNQYKNLDFFTQQSTTSEKISPVLYGIEHSGGLNPKYYNNRIKIKFNVKSCVYMGSTKDITKIILRGNDKDEKEISQEISDFSAIQGQGGLLEIELNLPITFVQGKINSIGIKFTTGATDPWIEIPIGNTDFYHYSRFDNQAYQYIKNNNNYWNNFVEAFSDEVTLKTKLDGKCEITSHPPYKLYKKTSDKNYTGTLVRKVNNTEEELSTLSWDNNNAFLLDYEKDFIYKIDSENNVLIPKDSNNPIKEEEFFIKTLVFNLFTGENGEILLSGTGNNKLKTSTKEEEKVMLRGPVFSIKTDDEINTIQGNILLKGEKLVKTDDGFQQYSLSTLQMVGTQKSVNNFKYCRLTTDTIPSEDSFSDFNVTQDYTYFRLLENKNEPSGSNNRIEETHFIWLKPVIENTQVCYYKFQLGRTENMIIDSAVGDSSKILKYYLIDNGGDRTSTKNGNSFIKDRFSLEPQYFSLSRQGAILIDEISSSKEAMKIEIYDAGSPNSSPVGTCYLHLGEVDKIETKKIGDEVHHILPFSQGEKLFKENTKVSLNIGAFFSNNFGQGSYKMVGTYYYYFGNSEKITEDTEKKEILTFSTQSFSFATNEAGTPVLGLRHNGVVINPTRIEATLDTPEGLRINTRVESDGEHGDYYSKPLSIVLYDEELNQRYQENSIDVPSFDITYVKNSNNEGKFYIDGVNLRELQDKVENDDELEGRVEDLEDAIDNETDGLRKLIADNKYAIDSNIIPYLPIIKTGVVETTHDGNPLQLSGQSSTQTVFIRLLDFYDENYDYLPFIFLEDDNSASDINAHRVHCFLADDYVQTDKETNQTYYVLKVYVGIHSSHKKSTATSVEDDITLNYRIAYRILKIRKPFTTMASTSSMPEAPMVTLLEDEDPYASVLSMQRPDEQTVLVEEPGNIEVPNEPEDEEI